MVDKMQALQIALNYLCEGEEAPSAKEELLRASDEYHFSLDPETFWKFDVRGHAIWTISHQSPSLFNTSEHPTILHIDSVTGDIWEFTQARPPV